MGAGASASNGDNKETGGSMFEALKAQEDAKNFYTKRIAEIIAKDFENLKAKGSLPQNEMENEIMRLLQVNEPYIMAKPPPISVAPLEKTPSLRRAPSFSERNTSKGARRRSFDNLVYDDIAQRDPKSYDEAAPRNFAPTKPSGNSGRIQMDGGNSGRIALSEIEGGGSGRISSVRISSFVSDGGEHYSNSDPEAMFRRMCVESVQQIATKKNLTHMAAVDGSDGGHMAFQTMMLMKKKLDHVCVFHAYSKNDPSDELPEEFQADAVRARYENELITKLRMPTTKFTFYWEDKKQRSIRKVIMELLNNYKGVKNPMRPTRNEPNFFFCGYTGIKGSKVDNSTLGSVTDIALRSVHMPIIICKTLCSSNSRVFVIAVDGSEHSRNGFDIAMALVKPKDKLFCITVEKKQMAKEEDEDKEQEKELDSKVEPNMSAAAIREYYSSELQSYGPADCEFVSLQCCSDTPGQTTVAECLVHYSDSVEADFFAISPRARPIFTSVTEYIIANVKASIILCKN